MVDKALEVSDEADDSGPIVLRLVASALSPFSEIEVVINLGSTPPASNRSKTFYQYGGYHATPVSQWFFGVQNLVAGNGVKPFSAELMRLAGSSDLPAIKNSDHVLPEIIHKVRPAA